VVGFNVHQKFDDMLRRYTPANLMRRINQVAVIFVRKPGVLRVGPFSGEMPTFT
jgi:hypothetical protein